MKKLYSILLMAMLGGIGFLPLLASFQTTRDEAAVREIIAEGYIKGAWTEKDETAMRKGFDIDFVWLTLHGNHMHKHPLNAWIENIAEQAKTEEKNDSVTFKIPLVDVTGMTAFAKVELYRNNHLFETDYVGLYKFGEYWQIVNMITQQHQ